MQHPIPPFRRTFLILGFVFAWYLPGLAHGDTPRGKSTPALPGGAIPPEAWRQASEAPLTASEIDRLVNHELEKCGIKPAAITTDEQFLRRLWLDVTGKLPMPADLQEFQADNRPAKRAQMIDKLLASDDFARHWAEYWRNVITSRIEDRRGRLLVGHFDAWLTDQFKRNKGWGEIATAMLTAKGKVSFANASQNGQAFLLTSRLGNDAITEIAAETSRIFLGIRIQCAQCHDHPSDIWKRTQFHEFTAYFARVRARPFREAGKLGGLQLVSLPRAEYKMPSRENPRQGTVMQPRFLDGKAPGGGLSDSERRDSLARAITARDNPWFAAAFVNRIWGELMGQSFYRPIDDLGPMKEAFMPDVLVRVAGAFRGSDYNIKELFRVILNSETYQRQIRPGESADDHLLFAASYARRMDADTLWHTLQGTLGQVSGTPPRRPNAGPLARLQGFEFLFKQEFNFDPSTRPEDVEGSISQALLLMNNPTINQKIQAQGTNLAARILKSYPQDDDALRILYLRALGRRPTDREMARCRQHIRDVGSRAEAFEDILWALVNSTEFQTRR
jgi:hypothetical protein